MDRLTRRKYLAGTAITAIAGCMSMNTDESESNELPEPSEPRSAATFSSVNNWVAAAHLEYQTALLSEQTELLREIRDELAENSDT